MRMIRGRRITSGGSGEASAALPPPRRRGLGRNRRREEFGWEERNKAAARAFFPQQSKAKRSKGGVSFVPRSTKKQFSPNPTTTSQKRNGNHRGANREEIEREEIWAPYHSLLDRAGSAADWGPMEDSGGGRNAGWMERDKGGPAAFPQGKREKRRAGPLEGGAVSSVLPFHALFIRADGSAPDRLPRVGPPGRGNFGKRKSWERFGLFLLPGECWWLFWARIRTFEIRWRGESHPFCPDLSRQRTGKDMRPEGNLRQVPINTGTSEVGTSTDNNNYNGLFGS
jgi:hypothetical protein